MYAEFLRHAGLPPLVVSDASPALSLAPGADVIVTGLLLPGQMDGVALIGRLKRDDRTKYIPIIVLTSSAWNTERERDVSAGCDLFLPKPCLPDELLRAIRRLLASSKIGITPRTPAKAQLPSEPDVRRSRHAALGGRTRRAPRTNGGAELMEHRVFTMTPARASTIQALRNWNSRQSGDRLRSTNACTSAASSDNLREFHNDPPLMCETVDAAR